MSTLSLSPLPGRRAHAGIRRLLRLHAVALALTGGAAGVVAQEQNFRLPAAEIERRLAGEPFQITGMADNRWQGDRTQRTTLRFRDGTVLPVKWARSAEGGFDLNNQPRYELAAYRLQSLFLDPDDRVVPPTVLRVMPLRVYRQLDPELGPTFEGTTSVLVVLQYWLEDVTALEAPDPGRLEDPEYARRLAHLNLLTYLIRHADSNTGNVLVSTVGEPRMYAVDNGVAFNSPDSPRGTLWKDLHIDRIPAVALERLRRLDRATLDSTLAVVAQLRVGPDGQLVPEEPGPKRNPNRGVEMADGVVQLGLTNRELNDVWTRLRELIRRADAGEITTY